MASRSGIERLHARAFAREHGEDAPEVAGWTWQPEAVTSSGVF